jgi:hypothetical protein
MKQVTILSTALTACLVASYVTWNAEDTGSGKDDSVVMFNAAADDLQSIRLTGDKLSVDLVRKTDAQGEYLWVNYDEVKDKPKAAHPPLPTADGSAADAEEPQEPQEERIAGSFTGNETADDLWAGFAPLKAIRELPASSSDLDIYGFDEPEFEIEVTRGSGPVTMKIGGESYGNHHRYVQYDGKNFLVDQDTLRPLQYARTRLVERRLYPLDEKTIEQVDVRWNDNERRFVQANRDDRAKAFWAQADSADKEDIEGGTWLGKAFRVKVHAYEDESELEGTLEPVMTIAMTGDGQTWPVEILKIEGEKTIYYAQAAFTRTLVRLTQGAAEEVVSTVEDLFDDAQGDSDEETEPATEGAEPVPEAVPEAVPEEEPAESDDVTP